MIHQVLRSTGRVGDRRGLGIDSQTVVERRHHFLHVNRALDRFFAKLVRGTDGLTRFHPATGQPRAADFGPVIATGVAVDFGCSTKLTPNGDRRVVEHPTLLQVFDQRAEALIQLSAMVSNQIKVLAVTIPSPETETHDAHARFDQTPGHQQMIVARRGPVVLVLIGLSITVSRDNLWVLFG